MSYQLIIIVDATHELSWNSSHMCFTAFHAFAYIVKAVIAPVTIHGLDISYTASILIFKGPQPESYVI